MGDHYNEHSYDFEWSAFSIADGQAPDTDTVIEVRRGETIHVQFATTATANVSTDVDMNVITSVDGVTYDTVYYASSTGLGDAGVQSFVVTPGPRYMKLRADNNDGANNAAPTAKVWIRS